MSTSEPQGEAVIESVVVTELLVHVDDRGFFYELMQISTGETLGYKTLV